VSRLAVVVLLAAAALLASACGGSASANEVTVRVRYSHFEPDVVTVTAGQPVTFTLRNDDPIEHEWIVGPPVVHERHRNGTEAFHGTIPTEVTLPYLSTRVTTVTFEHAGEYQYVCHLPAHEAYGMVGTVRVVER
jgi:plastocyanin